MQDRLDDLLLGAVEVARDRTLLSLRHSNHGIPAHTMWRLLEDEFARLNEQLVKAPEGSWAAYVEDGASASW